MTQTTAERIEKQLNDIYDTYPGSVYDCFRVIAKEIAYDIDRLQRELAEARAFISTVIDAPKDYPAEEGM